ncbi:MAG: sugar phosphate nucleotidyltransferase [Caulobacter sp.]|nr:sugar phosphate nucleotidyltransferase [Caulobacter sp.]
MGAAARQGVILMGGLGTRLGNLSSHTPKPMLPVQGRPFVEWLIEKARRTGIERMLLLCGHRAEVVEAWRPGAEARFDISIEISREPQPLGTAGALIHARAQLADDFLLLNGDTWFDFDWSALALQKDDLGALALRPVSPADRYETITLASGRAIAINPRNLDLGAGLINAGVYRLRPAALDGFSAPASLEGDVLPVLASRGALAGQRFEGGFIDIGLPETYDAAQTMDLGAPQ